MVTSSPLLPLSYTSTETSVLKYSTKSSRAKGPIDKVSIDFGGLGYDSLPSFVSVASTQGTNATLLPDSTNINRVDDIRILNPGFEYSSDPTLKPEAFISPVISIINADTISNIEVIEGGRNYTSQPDLKIINPPPAPIITPQASDENKWYVFADADGWMVPAAAALQHPPSSQLGV